MIRIDRIWLATSETTKRKVATQTGTPAARVDTHYHHP